MDMSGSLQQQMFMQMNPTLGQGGVENAHNQYLAMQQQMRAMQMQQAQSVAPMNTMVGGVSGAVNNFMAGQMAGIYSGYGITPGMRAAFNQYVGSPTADYMNQTMGVGRGLLNVYGSNRVGALTYEQRNELSATLSRGLMNTGLTALGAVGTIGGIIGGMAAGTAGFGLSLAGMGAKAFMTSKTMNTIFGGTGIGIATGWNADIFSPTKFIKQEIARDDELTSLFNTESYRFMSPTVSRGLYGVGLTRSQSQEWASRARRFDTKFRLKSDDVDSILKTVIDNDLITNVTGGIDEFEERFGKQVEYIKNASKIMNKSVKEVSDMMAELKQAGFSTENFDIKAAEIKNYAAILGKNVDTVKEFMLSTAKVYTQGTSNNVEVVGSQMMFGAASIQQVYDKAKREGDEATYSRIINNGGAMGQAALVRGAMNNIFGDVKVSTRMASFFKPTANGFEFDRDAMNEAYAGILNGTLTGDQLTNMGAAAMSSWDGVDMKLFKDNAAEFISGQDEVSINKMLKMAVESYRGSVKGLGSDATTAEILQIVMNQDRNTALAIEDQLKGYEIAGVQTAVSNIFMPMKQRSIAFRQTLVDNKMTEGFNLSNALMHAISDPFVNTTNKWETALSRRINTAAGLVADDILEYTPSAIQYDFLVEGTEETEKIREERMAETKKAVDNFISNFSEEGRIYIEANEENEDIIMQDKLTKLVEMYKADYMNAQSTVEAMVAAFAGETYYNDLYKAVLAGASKEDIQGIVGDSKLTRKQQFNLNYFLSDDTFEGSYGRYRNLRNYSSSYRDLITNAENVLKMDEIKTLDFAKYFVDASFMATDMLNSRSGLFYYDKEAFSKQSGKFSNLIASGTASVSQINQEFSNLLDVMSNNNPTDRNAIVGYLRGDITAKIDEAKSAIGDDLWSNPQLKPVLEALNKIQSDAETVQDTEIFSVLANLDQVLTKLENLGNGATEEDINKAIEEYPQKLEQYYQMLEESLENLQKRIDDPKWALFGRN